MEWDRTRGGGGDGKLPPTIALTDLLTYKLNKAPLSSSLS
jgi:hypothetical protein